MYTKRLLNPLRFIAVLTLLLPDSLLPTSELSLDSKSIETQSIGITTRLSIATSGAQGNGWSFWPSMSADGRYVAFESNATNLVSGDTNGFLDIFVHDRQIGQTTRVSVATGGTEGNEFSNRPSISADGRFVAFESRANNLVSGDTNLTDDIFIHDRQLGETTRVTIAMGGGQSNNQSWAPFISADGRFVAFSSFATNLVNGDTNGEADVFVHDRQSGQNTRASIATDGTQSNDFSYVASISSDGRIVSLVSWATNLVNGDTNSKADVFVHDRQTGQTTRVSISTDGAQSNGDSSGYIAGNGRYEAFTSEASNLVNADTNYVGDIFVRDRQTGQTTRVSVSTNETQGNGYAGFYARPSISTDGRYVAFESLATNLVTGDSNGHGDVFLHDRQTGQTILISIATDGSQGNGKSDWNSVSSDGRYVAFASAASNLVNGDTNGVVDIFVHDRGGTNPTYSISGRVTNPSNSPISAVTVSTSQGQNATTDANGNYTLTGLAVGTYTLTASRSGYTFSPASRTVTVPPNATGQDFTASTPDFTVSDIELTQAIQDLNNSVPLIANKRTFARVYARNVSVNTSALVSARLCGPGRCILPLNSGGRIQVPSNPDRGRLDNSYYFELPPEWLTGNVLVTAEVNPSGPDQVLELNFGNNLLSTSAIFGSANPLVLRLVNVRYGGGNNWYRADETHLAAIESWLRRAYPISSLQIRRSEIEFDGVPASGALGASQVWGRLRLERNLNQLFGEASNVLYYGVVADSATLIRGVGALSVAVGPTGDPARYADPRISWDTDGSFGDFYAGHEIGHLLGGWHAPCGVESPPWENYPYPNGVIGGPSNNANRFYGFDIERMTVYPPDWHDVMSYCARQWISDYNYNRFRQNIPDQNTLSSTSTSSTGEHVVVIGSMNLSRGMATLDTLYRLPNTSTTITPISSTFSIRLISGSGSLIAQYPFLPAEDSETQAGEDQTAHVSEVVPWATGTQRVAIFSGAVELASRVVSANSPVVTVVSPNGGEVYSNAIPVSWNASDADGGTMTIVIQYSPDNGTSWQVVAAGITSMTSYNVDLSLLPGSSQGRIRVLTSDGVNTGQDTSDGSFSVQRKLPSVWIISPANGSHYAPLQTPMMVGEARDVEDGVLSDQSLRWKSDRDGELGTGRLMMANLSQGWHTITLTATDSDGNTTSASISVFVGQRVFLPLVRK